MGNGIITAPLLAAFERCHPGWRYFMAPNIALDAEWVRSAVGMHGASGTFPALWRRFSPADRDALWNFIDRTGVELVVNLRMESAEKDGNYFEFRAEAMERGVECWDLHELGERPQRVPFAEQAAGLLRAHGVPVDLSRPAWLAGLRRPRPGVVGCYVGASAAVKRWPARDWSTLITHLGDRGLAVEVAVGPGADEQASASRLLSSPVVADSVFPDSLEALRDWIAGLDVLVSNDTVAAHLAAALGCPVVTLYLATDGDIWSPVAAPDVSRAVQSAIALSCSYMKPDGTCQRYYSGCPAPCAAGVRPADVLIELDQLKRSGRKARRQEVDQ
ncbi:glycosyltransferase family 9 protein [Actinomadura rubrisoli]|uniref:glycosyltransferase family 9 protein n=1 Tax=Actinomadura rubrisoli TaxID=2530368 RepID=UPI001404D0A4|nr:glycosyltransferase family 9 protein [Actinomadura rubrisoli]